MGRTAIVTTTIYVPKAIHAYMKNAKENGHSDAIFIVAGDKKTPPEAKQFCDACAEEFKMKCQYLTVDDQINWLQDFPELASAIPWNSIQRRNIAILLAYQIGCEIIITIDDDNYFVEGQDFIGEHIRHIKDQIPHTSLVSNTGWLNVCEYLEDKRKFEFYPRGYPMNQRWRSPKPIHRAVQQNRKVVVNAGLWLDDPDVDAITRLCNDISAERYLREDSFSLSRKTWCPFNSQNTAISREVIPGYCLSPNVGRYDDIWAGYVVMAIADKLDHAIMFGFPLVKQERNPHNYFNDHQAERIGLEFTETFCEWLREAPLKGTTYLACLGEIVAWLQQKAEGASNEQFKDQVFGFCLTQEAWIKTMERMNVV
ncbi:hypothetical protein GUITHDRAFT_150797 [Guillardia theta CCMP2712]|uniref:Glycosyltransferase 2-like domain-containing protein n=2 Tax=Guillardia theta TaxID=55529 RepID=L1JU79_GUITC|nr:hypothetical protein GUITHDRAFT_150797 [Guillardia theta CCMP2712]EKX51750.1 hypothetical protein GUITHDRAFT_150797 [Guillardia theta CCMP2712]|eukprot:XP_005838730.1 hypothetical protein GUITHDRAFT_150797 [Guillardia theta CCMP2712]